MLEIGKTYKFIDSTYTTNAWTFNFDSIRNLYVDSSNDTLVTGNTHFRIISREKVELRDGSLSDSYVAECTNTITEVVNICCIAANGSHNGYKEVIEEVKEIKEENHEGMIYNPITNTWSWF